MQFQQFVNESINEPIKLKALFLCGLQNAGKSTILERVVDLPLMHIDSDRYVELLSKRDNVDLDFGNEKDLEIKLRNRQTSFKMVAHQMRNTIDSLQGVIVNGTGRNLPMMEDNRTKFTTWGYDVAMLYVNTDLEVALARNAKRIRKIPVDDIIAVDAMIKSNLPTYEKAYGRNFFEYNSDIPPAFIETQLRRFFTSPVENTRGKQILAEMQQRKLKYMSQLDPAFSSLDFNSF